MVLFGEDEICDVWQPDMNFEVLKTNKFLDYISIFSLSCNHSHEKRPHYELV